MGCCHDRNSEELKDAAGLPPKAAAPKMDAPETKSVEKKPESSPPAKNEVFIHVKPGSTLRFEKVFRILAGSATVTIRQTADLSSIGARIPRYPAAEYKAQVLPGERVIARYLAQVNGFYPSENEAIYQCESLVDQIIDMWQGLATVTPEALYQQAELLGAIERRLKPGSNFFVGGKTTIADVFVFCFLMEFYLFDIGVAVAPVRMGVSNQTALAAHQSKLAEASSKGHLANAVPKRLQDFVAETKENPLFRK